MPFALFSKKMSMEKKESLAREMLKHLLQTDQPVYEIQRSTFPIIDPDTKLEDLVGDRSFLLFSRLAIAGSPSLVLSGMTA